MTHSVKYRADIDGLRAVAVLLVILFHAGVSFLEGGFVGVDVFFVISGFLITGIILEEKSKGAFSLAHFYERRARRILPALFTVMAVSVALAWLFSFPDLFVNYSKSLASVSLFSSNILFWQERGYFSAAAELKPLLHTWSLAVEEQYYLVFPLLMLILWRWRNRSVALLLALAGIASLGLAHWAAYHKPSAAFFLLPARGWEILLGVLAQFYTRANGQPRSLLWSNLITLAGLGMIVAAALLYDSHTPFPSLYALLPTVGAALIMVFCIPGTWAHRLLTHRLCVGIGLLSYGAYLWHQPLFAFTRQAMENYPSLGQMLGLAILSFVLAYFSWRYVEQPFRNKQVIGRRTIVVFSMAGIVAFILIGAIGIYAKGFPQRYDNEVHLALAGKTDINPLRERCLSSDTHLIPPSRACVLGNAGNVKLALIGDSHADAVAHSLGEGLSEVGIGAKNFTLSACPPLRNIYVLGSGNTSCETHNKRIFSALKEDPSLHTVIVVARWTRYLEGTAFDNHQGGVEEPSETHIDVVVNGRRQVSSPAARPERIAERYQNSVLELLHQGKRVILVYPIPEVGWDVPYHQAKVLVYSGQAPDLVTNEKVFRERNRRTLQALDALDAHSNLIRVRPDEVFCGLIRPDTCSATLNGRPLYYDDDHLNNYGAGFLVEKILKFL